MLTKPFNVKQRARALEILQADMTMFSRRINVANETVTKAAVRSYQTAYEQFERIARAEIGPDGLYHI